MTTKHPLSFSRLFPLYMVTFLGFFGFALTIALFIPMLMDEQYALLPAASSTALRASVSGFLLAMYPLGQFLGSPIFGRLSDNLGRKKVLLLTLGLCAMGFLCIALCIYFQCLVLLFISCLLTGVCESNMVIVQSVIADHACDTQLKNKLIGYAYSACSLGYVMGPLVGGILAHSAGYAAPFALTALGVLLLIAWLQVSFEHQQITSANFELKFWQTLTSVKSVFTQQHLRRIYLINFMIFFAVQGLYRVASIYVVSTWQPNLTVFTHLIAFVSFLCLLANLLLMGPASRRFATQPLLAFLLLSGGLFILIMLLPEHFNWIWLTYGLAAMPTAMALATCTTWLSSYASSTEQGQVLGNNQALLVLGEASSASIGGVLAAISVPLPLMAMASILLLAGVMVCLHKTG